MTSEAMEVENVQQKGLEHLEFPLKVCASPVTGSPGESSSNHSVDSIISCRICKCGGGPDLVSSPCHCKVLFPKKCSSLHYDYVGKVKEKNKYVKWGKRNILYTEEFGSSTFYNDYPMECEKELTFNQGGREEYDLDSKRRNAKNGGSTHLLDQDEDTLFMLSLIPEIKKIPNKDRLKIKTMIINLVLNAQQNNGQLHYQPYRLLPPDYNSPIPKVSNHPENVFATNTNHALSRMGDGPDLF